MELDKEDLTLFDRRGTYQEFDKNLEQDLRGQTFQVCTVRQRRLKDVALGNLFWLLQAAKAKRRGADVVVTDFYDKRDSSNQGILELMEILGMNDAEGVTFRRAEDIQDGFLWADLSAHIREVGEDGLEWAMIGKVRQGIRDVLKAPWMIPESMNRLLEELSVWIDGIDSDSVVQLMNHEKETMRWVRALRPEARKQYWRVALPFQNEYRGRYRDVTGPEPEIIQRRTQDLAGKLAIGRTGGQPEEHAEFYETLFRDLVSELDSRFRDEADRHEFRGPVEYKYTHVPRQIVGAIMRIDPRLALFLIGIFETDDEGTEPVKLVGNSISRNKNDKKLRSKIIEGIKMIGDAELAGESPSLERVIATAGIFAHDDLVYDKGLNTMLLDERWDINELADYWIKFVENCNDLRQPKFWVHPVAVKLATAENLSDEKWLKLRKVYQGEIFGNHSGWLPLFSNPLEMPVVKRVIDEVFDEDIDKARQLLWDFFYFRQQRDRHCSLGRAGDRDIIRYLVEKYSNSENADPRWIEEFGLDLDKLDSDLEGRAKAKAAEDQYRWGY